MERMNRIMGLALAAVLAATMGTRAATVSGTVREGSLGGGGAQGAAVAGAKVVLISVAGGGGGGIQNRLDSTVTNAQGQYTFANATTGFRTLEASKAGYGNGIGFVNVANDTGRYTANINLPPAPRTGPGVVMGAVRRGSGTGPGISGANVVITRTLGGGGGGNQPDTVRTDARGNYRFDSVAAAAYTVRVTATGYQAGTDNVVVPAGDTAVADFELMPLNASGSAGGKVTKASDGSPIANAQVVLSRTGFVGVGGQADTVQTNALGVYSFDSVGVNSNYVVTVRASGFQTAVNQNVDVVLDVKTVADFALVAAGTDSANGSISGLVTDATHKALSGARVILARSQGGGGPGGAAVDTVMTDAQGRFTFPTVPEQNNYRLTVSLAGFQTATDNNVDVVGGQSAVANFVLVNASGIRSAGAAPARMSLARAEGGSLILEFPASVRDGRVSIFDMRGRRRFTAAIPAGATRMEIPRASGARYVVAEREGRVERFRFAGWR